LLVVRFLPKQSLLKRMLRRLGSRIFKGAQIGGRSARARLTARQPCHRDGVRDEIDVATGDSCAAGRASISTSTTIGWPSRCGHVGTDGALSTPRHPGRAPRVAGEFAIPSAPNDSSRWRHCRWSA
jgi:hypothetical protein